jgi:hypothetical protein
MVTVCKALYNTKSINFGQLSNRLLFNSALFNNLDSLGGCMNLLMSAIFFSWFHCKTLRVGQHHSALLHKLGPTFPKQMSNSRGTDDDGLLARLNALKGTDIKSDGNRNTSISNNQPERSLESRFRQLSGDQKTRSLAANFSERDDSDQLTAKYGEDEDDETLDELLGELGAGNEWAIPESNEIQALLKEAKAALPKHENDSREAAKHTQEDVEIGNQPESNEKKSRRKSDAEDEAEADEYVQKVLSEVAVEDKMGPGIEIEENVDSAEAEGDQASSIELPTAPSAEPASSTRENANKVDDDLAARLSALSLPGAPTKAPATKSTTHSKQSGLPKYADEEIDSWCIICCDDATVRCLGCDGDLYCADCWKEGHTGEEAGLEERKHKAIAFEKPGDKNRKQKVAA